MIRYSTVALFLFLQLTLNVHAKSVQCSRISGEISDYYSCSSTGFPGKCGKLVQDLKETPGRDQARTTNLFVSFTIPASGTTAIDQYLLALSAYIPNHERPDDSFMLRACGHGDRSQARGSGSLPPVNEVVNMHYKACPQSH